MKQPTGRMRARIQALQLLFQAEVRNRSVETLLEEGDYALEDGPLDEFAAELALGAYAAWAESDEILEKTSKAWSVSRMPLVDKNILRLALYEMKYRYDIPIEVSINEAVELSKMYAQDESPKFINGVLGKVARSGLFGEVPSLLEIEPFDEDEDPYQKVSSLLDDETVLAQVLSSDKETTDENLLDQE